MTTRTLSCATSGESQARNHQFNHSRAQRSSHAMSCDVRRAATSKKKVSVAPKAGKEEVRYKWVLKLKYQPLNPKRPHKWGMKMAVRVRVPGSCGG